MSTIPSADQVDEFSSEPVLIEPRGNALMLSKEALAEVIDAQSGLGPVLVALGGCELLNDRLFPYLDSSSLCILSSCSRALYALIVGDDSLWRELAISTLSDETLDARIQLFRSWQSVATGRRYSKRKLGRLFSDSIHRPIQCASSPIDSYWLSRDNVVRVVEPITTEDFVRRFEIPKIPVLLKGFAKDFATGIDRWKDGLSAGMSTLDKSGRFRCGPRSLDAQAFVAYSSSPLAKADESPLYIFDARFAETFDQLGKDYTVPAIFKGEGRDLFEYLGSFARPDYRWIIAGASRSGSKWHVDPNCTHAWNCSMLGRKKWVMLPPWGQPPPGVFPSPDGGSVAQPVSLMEWFLEFYKTTRKTRENDLIEFVADVGDLVFVPSGWWHAVLNVDESFAVTQNYVSTSNIARAMRMFVQKPDQISGLSRRGGKGCEDRRKTFAQEFRAALPAQFIELCIPQNIEDDLTAANVAWSALVSKPDSSTNKHGKEAQPSGLGFSFGFNVETEDI